MAPYPAAHLFHALRRIGFGLKETRQDAVYGDAPLSPFRRSGPGEVYHRTLAGVVGSNMYLLQPTGAHDG